MGVRQKIPYRNHAARHAPGGSDPISAGAPTYLYTAINSGGATTIPSGSTTKIAHFVTNLNQGTIMSLASDVFTVSETGINGWLLGATVFIGPTSGAGSATTVTLTMDVSFSAGNNPGQSIWVPDSYSTSPGVKLSVTHGDISTNIDTISVKVRQDSGVDWTANSSGCFFWALRIPPA